ncbi:MAG: hypothetical protein AB7E36_14335 [Salinivirgaceae bacterium]
MRVFLLFMSFVVLIVLSCKKENTDNLPTDKYAADLLLNDTLTMRLILSKDSFPIEWTNEKQVSIVELVEHNLVNSGSMDVLKFKAIKTGIDSIILSDTWAMDSNDYHTQMIFRVRVRE